MTRPRWYFGSGAAERATIWTRLAAFGRQHGVQIYLQPGGLNSIRPLRELPAP